ncbi:MAG: hypothetical protein IT355_19730 [Gemmatimonadaceae bacterium]|nr:hypothetical protein [Gemmatimonadaceae bacterium]
MTASTRRTRMAAGSVALRDALRALRGQGAARRGSADDTDRGAMFDLAALADRLAGFAEDQGEDDWGEFWVTTADVETLERRTAFLAAQVPGLAAGTLPALQALHRELAAIAQPPE